MKKVVIHIQSPDKKGIISTYTEVLSSLNVNIIKLEQHVESDDQLFFMRIEAEILDRKLSQKHDINSNNIILRNYIETDKNLLRNGFEVQHLTEGDPDFAYDASRLYVSSHTAGDFNFDLYHPERSYNRSYLDCLFSNGIHPIISRATHSIVSAIEIKPASAMLLISSFLMSE